MGRKKKEVSEKDLKRAEKYAFRGHKNNTICELMDWEHNFINDRPDIRKRLTKKRAERKDWLKKEQDRIVQLNSSAAATMAIFLGKNELDQADKKETKITGAIGTRELDKKEMAALLRDRIIDCEDAIAS